MCSVDFQHTVDSLDAAQPRALVAGYCSVQKQCLSTALYYTYVYVSPDKKIKNRAAGHLVVHILSARHRVGPPRAVDLNVLILHAVVATPIAIRRLQR